MPGMDRKGLAARATEAKGAVNRLRVEADFNLHRLPGSEGSPSPDELLEVLAVMSDIGEILAILRVVLDNADEHLPEGATDNARHRLAESIRWGIVHHQVAR